MRYRFLYHLTILCLSFTLLSLATISSAQIAGQFTGRVMLEDTKEPAIGATIRIVELISGTKSDVDGRYTIENIPPGTYTLRFSYIGYEQIVKKVVVKPGLNKISDVKMASEEFAVLGCPILTVPQDISILTPLAGKISGIVSLNDTRRPAAAATVEILELKIKTKVAKTGDFWYMNVPPGTYTLRYDYPDYFSEKISNVVVERGWGTDQFVELRPDTIVKEKKNGKITGRIMLEDKKEPAVDALVQILDLNFYARSDKTGYYTIKYIPPGSYNLSFWCNGYVTTYDSVVVTLGNAVTKDVLLKPYPRKQP